MAKKQNRARRTITAIRDTAIMEGTESTEVGEDLDDTAHRFFAAGDRSSDLAIEDETSEIEGDWARLSSPEVCARRARFRVLTKRIVFALGLVTLVAFGKARLPSASAAPSSATQNTAHAIARAPQDAASRSDAR